MGATPGRKTVIKLNTPVTLPQNGNWWMDLQYEDISTGKQSSNAAGSMPSVPPNGNYHVAFTSLVGWRPAQYQETANYRHETTLTDAGDVDPAGWAATNGNTGMFSAFAHAFPSWLPGVGSTTGAAGPNDKYYMKYANAVDTIAVVNATDQASYPSPNADGVDTPFITMDRVYVGTDNHNPDEDLWVYTYVPPSTPFKAAQIVDHTCFTGIPTYVQSDGTFPGTGQYAVTRYMDGTYIVQEACGTGGGGVPSGTGKWVVRFRGNWCNPHNVCGYMHAMAIRSDAYLDANNHWQGRIIQFTFDNTNGSNAILQTWQLAIGLEQPTLPDTYQIIQISPIQPTPQPIRLDVRRDVFLAIRMQVARYLPVGYLRVKTQLSPFEPKDPTSNPTSCPLKIEVFGLNPKNSSGTSSTVCYVYEHSSGTQLDLISNIITQDSIVFTFKCPHDAASSETYFDTVIVMSATPDKKQAPLVKRVTFVRDPILKTSITAPLTVPAISEISFSGAGRDISHETISFTAPDLKGILDPILTKQGGQTFTAQVNDLDGNLLSIIQKGRLVKSPRRQRGNNDNITGYPRWGIYDCTGLGEWAEMHKLKTFKVYNFAANQRQSFKVTKAIGTILADHYLPKQYEIPDLPQTFFAQGNDTGTMQVESYTPMDDLLAGWARFYFGAFWVWDYNYTNGGHSNDEQGCLRLIVPPSPPYNYKCQFLTTRPNGTKGIPAENPNAWPTLIGYNPDGSNLVQTFCRKFSFESNVLPPEGNLVEVTGIGAFSSQGTTGGTLASYSSLDQPGQGQVKLSSVLHNWVAADFGQNHTSDHHPLPDPSHPDYTDGIVNLIYHCDPSLRTTAACDFMARRIMDMAGHTQYFELLEAPYIWIYPQHGDTKWIRPRGLRFGDEVLFNGKPMFVFGAPSGKWEWGRDTNQMAYYELRSIPALTAGYSQSGWDEQYKGLGAVVS